MPAVPADADYLPEPCADRLRTGFRVAPLGLPAAATTLSWSPRGAGAFDVVLRDESGGEVWSARTGGARAVVPDGVLDRPGGRYSWTLSPADGPGQGSPVTASFELGLSAPDWSAAWISTAPVPYPRETFDPAPYLRAEFEVAPGSPRGRRRLFATALGLYRVWLNGTELTAEQVLRPGWTDYRTRVHHQTFDCDDILVDGTNVLAVTLGKGWYAGRLGLLPEPGYYGKHPAFLAQLEEIAPDGSRQVLCATGSPWRGSTGAIQASDLLRGEIVDYRQEPTGWRDPGFDDAAWRAAVVVPHRVPVVPQPHDSIRRLREHVGSLVYTHAQGPAVFDFGQNLVGWTRIHSTTLPDTEIVVRHGETLTVDRLVARETLRHAFQEDRYVASPGPEVDLEPSFTSHGFRYAEVWGLPNAAPSGFVEMLPSTSVTAYSIETAHERVGTFDSSHPLLGRLVENIAWTVRDNFLEVITDCPQRDERCGWLGDAGVIAPTAGYLFDCAAFLAKFCQDAADAQGEQGDLPDWAPSYPPGDTAPGAPGWSDGYVRMLGLLVEGYGDTLTGERHFDHVRRYLSFVDLHNPDGLRRNAVGFNYGDWLSLPSPEQEGMDVDPAYTWTGAFSTSRKDVVGTAHTYRSYVQAAQIAHRLDRAADADRMHERATQIRQAYLDAFVRDDLTIEGATQTAYAQAIGFGLFTGAEAVQAAGHLRDLIEKRGYLTTGIHGVQHVLSALARHGHADLAIDLLLREELPSWLYMVNAGATTIWEKWDAIRPDGSRATAEMNSMNHCALGSVGAFLYEDLLGIRTMGAVFDRALTIAPVYTDRIDRVGGSTDGMVGRIESSWQRASDGIEHTILVPPSIAATYRAPAGYVVADPDAPGRFATELHLASGVHRLRARRG
ncbi:family 78 glycoside hydrolase catalytic domain [Nocardioides sp. WV_118_6]|uniref:family 78 glycoside hydrolase catalytic domain n=1 Tax=Nocardioides simplex TaxID=2045 RepID=UPI00214FC505|nr:family 78 glycoside hydrolase catalytic domain [Pimelobacter simplex]UUW89362.1 family 78 glycoside hydrolase catalytic domain [Pimelobacter simplex]UUW93190.1 family 78 glycoside hydrolase catalytic domain [Pimelobacter simplex]